MQKLVADFTAGRAISPTLYGIFFEDINFSIDGGINNNQVINHSFEFIYGVKKKAPFPYSLFKKLRRKHVYYTTLSDNLRYWLVEGGKLTLGKDGALAVGKHYGVVAADGNAKLINLGYNAGAGHDRSGPYNRDHEKCDAIGIISGKSYRFEAYLRAADFAGDLSVVVESNGKPLTAEGKITEISKDWTKYECTVDALSTGVGRLVISFNGAGTVHIDEVYFGCTDALGEGDPAYTGGKLRRDLVDSLRALKPTFVRFPGGCIVEGYNLDNSYRWKNTVGKPFERNVKSNLWGESQRDGGYLQSYQIGFYEYLLLCEELGAEPLPIVNAGMACQFRITQQVPSTSPDFQSYIDDAIDLIEFCNGDPATSKWAKLRADSGHPAPFNLKMMGIGNENFGELYGDNFLKIREAVEKHAPYMTTLFCVGGGCYKVHDYAELRKVIDANYEGHKTIVDDHFYRDPKWCFENTGMYDDYDRSKAPIFLGEWAANTPWEDTKAVNTYLSALSEAAFMTALERDADIVKMSSYAPLFSRMAGEQWKHNLINYNSLAVLHTANYYVQQMFSANYGATYVPVTGGGDKLYQSITTDGEYAYIKLVSTSESAEEIGLDLSGAKVATAEITSISGKDIERNTLGYDAPAPVETIAPKTVKIDLSKAFAIAPRSVNVIKAKLA